MNALRLMLGTLTVLRVPAPTSVDRRTAGGAMLLAPLGGLVLAVPLVLLAGLNVSSTLLAALVIGALALLTRALHLDGLADTADGLGSGRTGADALAVMRRSDIGPFGVVTLLLVLLMQVSALATLTAVGLGPAAVLAALLVSRGVLPVVCTAVFPPARRDGLGQAVAASVSGGAAAASFVSAVAVAALGALGLAELVRHEPRQQVVPAEYLDYGWIAATRPGYYYTGPFADWFGGSFGLVLAASLLVGALVALGASVLLARRCVRRFGGVTGDVYGACVELAFTTMLVLPALLLP